MNTKIFKIVGGAAVFGAIVAGVIIYLQNFDASKVACQDIASARMELQSAYDSGVNASVSLFAEEKAEIDERLSQCLSAKPIDPCADAQKARDASVEAFNGIASPPNSASYDEFKVYFKKRDEAYNNYKKAKEALESCRTANPPKANVPYEQSDTKACFDAYDASVENARTTFQQNTQTMRTALNSALAGLDAREKACNPPKGKEKFTDLPKEEGVTGGVSANDLLSCRLISPELDTELFNLRKRAGQIPAEIQSLETSINNIKKRMSPLKRDLQDVDTYIPPESAKTQFEGALNALRAERKVAIESSLNFYSQMLSRKEAEKSALENELLDLQAKISARLSEINKENEARSKKYPTALHLSKPDKCAYFHCHGMLCGKQDPAQDGCGHGSTSETDVDCKQFIDAYFKAVGVN